MTNDEKNEKLARLLGWTELAYVVSPPSKHATDGSRRHLAGLRPGSVAHEPVPDYCGDLNASWAAIQSLNTVQKFDFLTEIAERLDPEEGLNDPCLYDTVFDAPPIWVDCLIESLQAVD